jgi:hypothetical protein
MGVLSAALQFPDGRDAKGDPLWYRTAINVCSLKSELNLI